MSRRQKTNQQKLSSYSTFGKKLIQRKIIRQKRIRLKHKAPIKITIIMNNKQKSFWCKHLWVFVAVMPANRLGSTGLSRSSLSSGSLSQMGSNNLGRSPRYALQQMVPVPDQPPRDAPLYQRLKWANEHDEICRREVILGRRVGFYRFKSDLGAGNFSKVKMAVHQITKGTVGRETEHIYSDTVNISSLSF